MPCRESRPHEGSVALYYDWPPDMQCPLHQHPEFCSARTCFTCTHELRGAIVEAYRKLAERQVSLDPEYARVLAQNMRKLYRK